MGERLEGRHGGPGRRRWRRRNAEQGYLKRLRRLRHRADRRRGGEGGQKLATRLPGGSLTLTVSCLPLVSSMLPSYDTALGNLRNNAMEARLSALAGSACFPARSGRIGSVPTEKLPDPAPARYHLPRVTIMTRLCDATDLSPAAAPLHEAKRTPMRGRSRRQGRSTACSQPPSAPLLWGLRACAGWAISAGSVSALATTLAARLRRRWGDEPGDPIKAGPASLAWCDRSDPGATRSSIGTRDLSLEIGGARSANRNSCSRPDSGLAPSCALLSSARKARAHDAADQHRTP